MKIIINADDFGFTQGTNQAVFELARLGTLTSTSVMVNMDFANEAEMLLGIKNFSIGLHLNLTQGRPVLPTNQVASLVDRNGRFHDLKTLKSRAKQGRIKSDEVEAEIDAQWRVLHSIIGEKISHMDSHQGLNRIPFIFKCVLNFLRKQHVPAMRFYVKYYASGFGDTGHIFKPGLTSLSKVGPKRLLVEGYLKLQRRRLIKLAKAPDGMLLAHSHDTIDLLRWLTAVDHINSKSNLVLEIPCHPAKNVEGLVDTRYLEERVDEYELLRSPEFIEASKKWPLVDYSAIL